jgi:hypothetical protein
VAHCRRPARRTVTPIAGALGKEGSTEAGGAGGKCSLGRASANCRGSGGEYVSCGTNVPSSLRHGEKENQPGLIRGFLTSLYPTRPGRKPRFHRMLFGIALWL